MTMAALKHYAAMAERDIAYTTGRFDVSYGYKVLQPELSVRIGDYVESSSSCVYEEEPERMRCTYCGRIEAYDDNDQCDGCGAWSKEPA